MIRETNESRFVQLVKHVKDFLSGVLCCDWTLRMDSRLERNKQDVYTVSHPHLSDTLGSIEDPPKRPN